MVLMHRGEEEGGEEEEEEEEEMESIERSYLELLGAGGGDFAMVSKEEEVVVEEGFLFSPPYSSSNSSNYSSSTCCFPHMLNFGGSDHDHGFLMPSDQHNLSTLSPPPPPPPVISSKSKAKSSRRVSASRRATTTTTTTTTTEDCSTKNATNKKPKAQGTTKVRKEKIGDRINALQQLVSPFGKTDTATVLHEALGYIRFLHDQVQVLSSPYMQSTSPASSDHHEESEEKTKVGRMSKSHKKDLRSRGLCLVPVSCTETVADKNGADMWSPAPCSSGPKH